MDGESELCFPLPPLQLHRSAPSSPYCLAYHSQQEDRTTITTLSLNPEELQLTLESNDTSIKWEPASSATPPPSSSTASSPSLVDDKDIQSNGAEKEEVSALDEANRQVGYFAIFDG